jgi:signal peptidase I
VTVRRKILPAISLVCWLYLTVVASLGLWVGVTRVAFGWQPVVVTSDSMSPNVKAGDVVMVAPVAGQQLDRGDMVRFHAGDGSTVIHRIERINRDGSLQTKGDANPTPDPDLIQPKAVMGVGRLLVPVIGEPWLWRAEGQTAALVVWLGCTTAAIWFAFRPMFRRRTETPPTPGGQPVLDPEPSHV